MNETLKVLETRRSCRNFKPDMIKEEELMFVPLVIGMVCVGVMFHFIEKKGDIEAGGPVEKF